MTTKILLGGEEVLYALIDDTDFDLVSQFNWHKGQTHNGVLYARRMITTDSKQSVQAMHTFLTGYILTDHIDHDGLNNTRSNLREATHAQNMWNRRPQKGGTSQYKGVSWDKGRSRWLVQIMLDNKTRHIGRFKDEIKAALAYDKTAQELFGDHACTNFSKGVT